MQGQGLEGLGKHWSHTFFGEFLACMAFTSTDQPCLQYPCTLPQVNLGQTCDCVRLSGPAKPLQMGLDQLFTFLLMKGCQFCHCSF